MPAKKNGRYRSRETSLLLHSRSRLLQLLRLLPPLLPMLLRLMAEAALLPYSWCREAALSPML